MRKPILLLDVDGVITNILPLWLRAINEALDKNFQESDITEYDICKSLGMSEDDKIKAYENINSKRIARDLLPYDLAVENVLKLDTIADIYFVTSMVRDCPTWCYDRSKWLEKHFGTELGRKLIFTKHKFMIPGDIFVDDMPYNVEKWANTYHYKLAILWAHKYNDSNVPTSKNILRTNSWNVLERLVKSYA